MDSQQRSAVELIPFEESHFDLLIEWSPSAEFLLQWAGPRWSFPLTLRQLDAHLEQARASDTLRVYSVRLRGEPPVIGHGELLRIDRERGTARLARLLIGPAELRGRGHGEALVRALVGVAFGELRLSTIDLHVYPSNKSAIGCYERVGFRRVSSTERPEAIRMELHAAALRRT